MRLGTAVGSAAVEVPLDECPLGEHLLGSLAQGACLATALHLQSKKFHSSAWRDILCRQGITGKQQALQHSGLPTSNLPTAGSQKQCMRDARLQGAAVGCRWRATGLHQRPWVSGNGSSLRCTVRAVATIAELRQHVSGLL
jgi:hypothetical protein